MGVHTAPVLQGQFSVSQDSLHFGTVAVAPEGKAAPCPALAEPSVWGDR